MCVHIPWQLAKNDRNRLCYIYFCDGYILLTCGTGCHQEDESQDHMDLDYIARLYGVSNLMQNSNSMQSVANMSTAMISQGR